MSSKYLSNEDDSDAYELDDPKHPTYASRALEAADDADDTEPYLFTVLARDGRQFSIAKDEKTALTRASQVGGSVVPYTANPSTYWSGNGSNYDH